MSLRSALKTFALIELRIVLSIWIEIVAIMITILLTAPYLGNYPLIITVPIGLFIGAVYVSVGEWLERNTDWYNKLKYTGEINP